MFKNKKIIILLLVFIIILFLAKDFRTKDTVESNLDDLYPINIDDEEWSQLGSIEEMLEATQISIDILRNLSTEDLLELALKHPLAISILAYDDIDYGIEFLSENSNVFQELSSRDDKVNVLINKLKTYDLDENDEDEVIDKLLITNLLSSTDYSEDLSENDRKILNKFKER